MPGDYWPVLDWPILAMFHCISKHIDMFHGMILSSVSRLTAFTLCFWKMVKAAIHAPYEGMWSMCLPVPPVMGSPERLKQVF